MGVSFDLERSEQKASVDDQNGGGGRGGRKWTILSPRRLPNGAYTLFTLVAIVILFFGPVSLYKTTLSLAPLPSGPSPASPELITDAPLVQLHNSKEAYVTFLSEVSKDPWYGINTRLLLFQFKHDPLTYDPTRDFIVLTTPHIPLAVEDQLRAEGAIVIRKELILNMPGQHDANGSHVWKDQYTKLHAFNLTQYERVLFLDNDMMISKPLDEIWDDPGSWPDAGLASTSQNGADHPHPPENTYHEFNGGFWMARPDEELFKTLLQVKGYDTWAQEQVGLLNSTTLFTFTHKCKEMGLMFVLFRH